MSTTSGRMSTTKRRAWTAASSASAEYLKTNFRHKIELGELSFSGADMQAPLPSARRWLRTTTTPTSFRIAPEIHLSSALARTPDRQLPVFAPVLCPPDPGGSLSLVHSDFVWWLRRKPVAAFDCVATSYVVDVVRNIVEMVGAVKRVLVPHGLWVNCGPLQYHTASCNGVRLTWEEVVPGLV